MKSIKSQSDIEALQKAGLPEKILKHVSQYFKHILEAYGEDYSPQAHGWIVLLNEGDSLTFEGVDLKNTIKEFVDYNSDSNLYDVLTISTDFAMTYMVPNEPWVDKELLQQLETFQNYQSNNSEE